MRSLRNNGKRQVPVLVGVEKYTPKGIIVYPVGVDGEKMDTELLPMSLTWLQAISDKDGNCAITPAVDSTSMTHEQRYTFTVIPWSIAWVQRWKAKELGLTEMGPRGDDNDQE